MPAGTFTSFVTIAVMMATPRVEETLLRTSDIASILHDHKVTQAALAGSSHRGNMASRVAIHYPQQISDLVLVGRKQTSSITLITSSWRR